MTPTPTPTAIAGAYYVDSNQAGYSGTTAPKAGTACAVANAGPGTLEAPWCTIAQVLATQSSLGAGDQVLFKVGDVWNERLSITTAHGSPSAQLVFGTYGANGACGPNGNCATIDGQGVLKDCIDALNYGANQSYITIEGFECRNTTGGGSAGSGSGITIQTNNAADVGDIVQNNYIHNTGPGAFTGATVGPNSSGNCVAAASAVGGVAGPCDNGDYNNALDFEAFNCNGTTAASCANNVQFLNNTVRNVGGHNCVQIHHDTGNPVIFGNIVGPGCIHNFIDVKGSGAASPGVLVDSNIVTSGKPVGITTPACFYTENTFQTSEVITFQRNVCNGGYVGFQAETGGTNSTCAALPGGVCPKIIKWINNTGYAATGVSSSYQLPGNQSLTLFSSTCDPDTDTVENNIWDGGTVAIHNQNDGKTCAGGLEPTYNYNDTGGAQGNYAFGVTATGANDMSNVNPLYDNAAAGNFHISASSPVADQGLQGLVEGMTSMGAYDADAP